MQVAERCSIVISVASETSEPTQPHDEEARACTVRLRGSPAARPFEEGDASRLRFGAIGERRMAEDVPVARNGAYSELAISW